jgi:hypothetical protein
MSIFFERTPNSTQNQLQSAAHIHRLALWGDVGCGKDTWAATLQFAVERAGLALRTFDATTAEWQAETRARMAFGDFPRATDVPKSAAELKLLTFEISHHTAKSPPRKGQSILVQIPQAAGGWWTEPQKYRDLHLDAPDPYHYLAYSSGIICLLDPASTDSSDAALSLITMLEYLDLYRRRHKRRQPIRIAL